MSKCEIEVQVDRSPPNFVFGDAVIGRVKIRANRDFESDALLVSLKWWTHGRGNTDQIEVDAIDLPTQPWSSGETREFPFSFTVPDGPASYGGRIVNIDWGVHAQLDVDWAIDPKAKCIIGVAQGVREAEELPVGLEEGGPRSTIPGEFVRIGTIAMSALMALGGGVFMAFALLDVAMGRGAASEALLMALIPFIWMCVWGGVAFVSAKPYIARLRLGTIDIEVAPRVVRPGDGMRALIRMKPTRTLQINGIRARLVHVETAVSGSGTSRTTHSNKQVEMEVDVCGARSLARGSTMTEEAHLRIPAEAVGSFRAEDNALEWRVVVEVDIPAWPDFEWSEKVRVV